MMNVSTLLPATKLCEQLGINRRTLDRWLKDPSLGFPEPLTVNGRLYFDGAKVEVWKRQRTAASRKLSKHTAAPTTEAVQQSAA